MRAYPIFHCLDFYQQTFRILSESKAGDEVLVNYFVIREDVKGLEFLLWLYLAAARGVKVKLIIDSYGSCLPGTSGTEYTGSPISHNLLLFLQSYGVEVFVYRPIESGNIFYPKNVLNWKNFSRRNHNKILAFKQSGVRGVILGDSQWAHEHFDGSFQGHDIIIESDKVFVDAKVYCLNLIAQKECVELRELTQKSLKEVDAQEQLNKLLSARSLKKVIAPIESIEIENAQFVYSEIEFSVSESRKSIQNFEEEILSEPIEWGIYATPYFSPDKQFLKKLMSFVEKGGRLQIGKFRDDPYLPYGVLWACEEIFKRSLGLFEYNGSGNIHYKDLVTDKVVFIKSANGEGRSRFYNLDSGIIIRSQELAKIYKKEHERCIGLFNEFTDFSYHQIPHGPFEKAFKYILRPFYYHHL